MLLTTVMSLLVKHFISIGTCNFQKSEIYLCSAPKLKYGSIMPSHAMRYYDNAVNVHRLHIKFT